MRSTPAEPRRLPARIATCAGLCAALAGAPDPVRANDATPPPAPAASSAPPADFGAGVRSKAVEAAVARLREDPLLSGRHKTHRLEWHAKPSARKQSDLDPSWLQWFASLARFINDTSRFLLYGTVLVGVALLLVSGRHLVQLRAFRRRAASAALVSHVRELDVRPESLPDDVGAAAWALWQAGRIPAALSLLYRGALSRLIHRWRVPITASTTEGECLALAYGALEPAAQRYLTQLVRAWEAGTYGNRQLSSAMGETLCTGFGARFDAAPATQEAA